MDDFDRKIVATLQKRGRIRNAELAEIVGLSATPCARRVANLEVQGVIVGYHAAIDQTALGLPMNIFVSVELDRQSAEAMELFERAIRDFEEIMECHLMSGSRDILLRVVASDLADFDRFLETRLMRVPGVRAMQSSFTLRTIINRKTLPQRLLSR